jgi:hypothetical protein
VIRLGLAAVILAISLTASAQIGPPGLGAIGPQPAQQFPPIGPGSMVPLGPGGGSGSGGGVTNPCTGALDFSTGCIQLGGM